MQNILSKLPSFVWVFIFPLCIVGFIGGIALAFYLLANVEGFSSIIMILAFWGCTRLVDSEPFETSGANEKYKSYKGFWVGAAICYFALMGVAIDQPGNYIYNKPIEYFFCPENTSLSRYVVVSNPLPGRTDMTQSFDCIDEAGELVYQVSVPEIISVRFIEYVVIAYAVIGALYVYKKIRKLIVDQTSPM